MQAWFLSDIHIKDLNERNSIRLLHFLHSIMDRKRVATHLFLLGDIFDLWAGDSPLFAKKFAPLVSALDAIKKMGVDVVYFEGNHDIHVRKFWESRGIHVWTAEKYFQLGPFLVRMEHGDFINPDDLAYKRFRKFMRSDFMERVAYSLPGRAIQAIGNWGSGKSRKYSSVQRASHQEKFRQMIRTYARRVFTQGEFDYLITGHMHIRDELQWSQAGRKPCSINLGSWFDEALVLKISDSGHQWESV